MDLTLRNARIAEASGVRPVDIGIDGGRIVAIEPHLAAEGRELDVQGCFVAPGLIESHIHLDKSCILDRCKAEKGDLDEAIGEVARAKTAFTPEDVYVRGKRTLEQCIVHGTTHMRTQLEVDPGIGLRGLQGIHPLIDEYKWAIDIIVGHRTGFGHPEWLRTHPPATETAGAVKLLLTAGARMVGKTLTDELAYSLSGENMHYGTPVNPRCPQRIPGGSSSGSVVAVAGGLVDFALGTDCGGSMRLPASYCGVLGIRPTHGRVSLEGAIPFGPSFDTAGWFARTPEVLGKVGGVLLQEASAGVRPSHALIARDAFALLDDPIRRALAAPLEAIVRRLARCAEVTVSPDRLRAWVECFRVLQAAEVGGTTGHGYARSRPSLGVASGSAWRGPPPCGQRPSRPPSAFARTSCNGSSSS